MRISLLCGVIGGTLLLASCGTSDKTAPLAPRPSGSDAVEGTAPGPAPESEGADEGEEPGEPVLSGGDGLIFGVPLARFPTPAGNHPPLSGAGLDLDGFPLDAIVSGGPPKDGIPALTNPVFVRQSEVSYLGDEDLVLGIVVGGEPRAYPENIGWWHEIVNDRIGGQPISITFCPLTGTGLVFATQDEGGGQFELGVSGLLFNNNLVMYDRRDGLTLYPQLFFTAVEGPRQGESLRLLPVVETTWGTWKRLHPDTRVIAGGTYPLSQYTSYPYGDYRTNHSFLLFGLRPSLSRNPNPYAVSYPTKDGLLGVRLEGQAKAYLFADMGERAVIDDQVGGVEIAVVWDRASHLALPYLRQVDDQILSFEIDPAAGFPFGLRDRQTGTRWDVEGRGIEGPLQGKRLVMAPAHTSFWFAWVSFWQETEVWQP